MLESVEALGRGATARASYTNGQGLVQCNPGYLSVEGPNVFSDEAPYEDDYVNGRIYLWYWTGTRWAYITDSGWRGYLWVPNRNWAYLNWRGATTVATYDWNVTPGFYYAVTVRWYYYGARYYDSANVLTYIGPNSGYGFCAA